MKKNYQILISLFLLIGLVAISSGCRKNQWLLPSDFVGVTKVEVIDYLQNDNHQFRFLVFTSVDNALIDGFRNKYVENLSISRLPYVYLTNGKENVICFMYEILVDVKPAICHFDSLTLSFEQGVKEITFGYYEIISLDTNSSQIDVSLHYDLKPKNNIYDMQVIIHNYRLSDIYLEQIVIVDKDYSERFVMAPITDNIIISDNIKIISNIKLEISSDVFYTKGLINLKFTTDYLEFDHPTVYLIDNLPHYYHLKSEGIDINKLSIQT